MIFLYVVLSWDIELLDCIYSSGIFRDIEIKEGVAYCATGRGIELIDIHQSPPKLLTRIATPGEALRVSVEGELIIVADGSKGVRIMERKGLEELKEVGKWGEEGGYFLDVIINEGYIYALDKNYGLIILNAKFPSFCVEESRVGIKFPTSISITYIKGKRYAFITTVIGVAILDVQNPSFPYKVAFLNLDGTPSKVDFLDSLIIVALNEEGVGVIDVKEINSPKVIGKYSIIGRIIDVKVCEEYFFLVSYDNGLKVLRRRDFYQTESCSLSEYTYCVETYDKGICLGVREGLVLGKVTGGGKFSIISQYFRPGHTYSLQLKDNFLYSGNYEDGVKIIDISTPTNLKQVGEYDTDGAAWDIEIVKNHICVADDVGGVWMMEIKKKTKLEKLFRYKTDNYARGVAVTDSYAYVANYRGGLIIMDIREPDFPKEVGRYKGGERIWDVKWWNDYCFLAKGVEGLEIVDVREKNKPRRVSECRVEGHTWGIAISHPYCYLANCWGGVSIIDIREITSPILVNTIQRQGCATEVVVKGDYLFVANGEAGIYVMDISSPYEPKLVSHFDTPGFAKDIVVSFPYLFVADKEGGVLALEVRGLENKRRE